VNTGESDQHAAGSGTTPGPAAAALGPVGSTLGPVGITPDSGRRAREPARRPPAVLVVPALIGLAFLVLPLAGLLVRAPWSTLTQRLSTPGAFTALRLSLFTATVTTGICLVVGVPIAFLLARTRFVGQRLVRALVTLPLVLPPVVGGVALFAAFGRRGIVGVWLDRWFDFQLPFTTYAVLMAQTFVALPFLVVAVEGALRGTDSRYEEAAATLGASGWTRFRRVTLPLVAPGVAAGAVLSWARAFGEFGATITFAGSYPGRTETMPIQVYNALNTDPETAVVLSLLMVAVSIVILVSLRGRWVSSA
jgi:molybdate transport system permease protein